MSGKSRRRPGGGANERVRALLRRAENAIGKGERLLGSDFFDASPKSWAGKKFKATMETAQEELRRAEEAIVSHRNRRPGLRLECERLRSRLRKLEDTALSALGLKPGPSPSTAVKPESASDGKPEKGKKRWFWVRIVPGGAPGLGKR
jgi:hypothetical protein